LNFIQELTRDASEKSDETLQTLDYFEKLAVNYSTSASTFNETIGKKYHLKDEEEDYEFEDYDFKDEEKSSKSCQCLPSCSSISYGVEISQTSINLNEHAKDINKLKDRDEE
jgi:hypothetical protein